jgi:hypothetical protein
MGPNAIVCCVFAVEIEQHKPDIRVEGGLIARRQGLHKLLVKRCKGIRLTASRISEDGDMAVEQSVYRELYRQVIAVDIGNGD